MNILHIAPLAMKKYSGLTYSIPNFIKAQNNIDGIKAELLVSISTETKIDGFYYLDYFHSKSDLIKFIKGFDIVVFHSTYIYNHVRISAKLKRWNIPYIIVPRGGFSTHSKNVKKYKKMIGDIILFNRFFKSPNAIHFLTENEKSQSCYSTSNDFIVPNGVSVLEKKDNIIKRHEEISIVYIGRIDSYIKGLDVLIKSINRISKELRASKAMLYLYGPDTLNSKEKLKEKISKYDIGDIVKIKEAVFDEDKRKVLKSSNIFIQTSRSEGLPMGILEALSLGLPCIVTPGTNLQDEITKFDAGVAVDLTSQSISEGIIQLIKEIRLGKDYSNNACSLADRYSWATIAKIAIENYKKVIDKGVN